MPEWVNSCSSSCTALATIPGGAEIAAWFMNVYALTDLQRKIADKIAQKINKPVTVGRYVDITDSLHIYGSYFEDAKKEVEKMRQSPYTERAWESSHPAFEMMTQQARKNLAQDPDWYAKARS